MEEPRIIARVITEDDLPDDLWTSAQIAKLDSWERRPIKNPIDHTVRSLGIVPQQAKVGGTQIVNVYTSHQVAQILEAWQVLSER